jgi:Sulfotransferase family
MHRISRVSDLWISGRRILAEPFVLARDLRTALAAGNYRFITHANQKRLMRQNATNRSVIFVWIPKSAGTSIFAAMEKHGAQKMLSTQAIATYFQQKGVVTFGHIYVPALVQTGLVSRNFFQSSYKFTIVRNPFDRLVSLYEYLKRINYLPKTTTFDIFCEYVRSRAWEDVGLINHDGLNQLNPQTAWILDTTGKVFVDRIYRLEDLSDEWPEIWTHVGMPGTPPPLRLLNRSERKPLSQYFSDRHIKITKEIYHNDFAQLGYSSDPYWR